MGESKKQSDIIKALKVIGAYVIRVSASSRAGEHDLVVCYRPLDRPEMAGRFYTVEVKSSIGTASTLQLKKRQKIIEAGGKAIVSRTVRDAIKMLREDWI